jgi:VanZ family protein
MLLMFFVSAMPEPPSAPGGMSDKGAHGLAYALLGVLVLRALSGARWSGVTMGTAAAAFLIATVYGVSDELHQRYVPGRTADVRDLAADAVGALVGVGLVWACGIVLSIRRRV